MQKEVYPVNEALQQYLQQYQRDIELPVTYKELFHYQYTDAIKDEQGKHTHWERVVYEKSLLLELQQKLIANYRLLKNESDISIQSIDFCEFANSMPFRINIIRTKTKQPDCFYIKDADASRIYGLELEQLLSTNPINFLYHQHTLVEEHISGIPGDIFLATAQQLNKADKQLLANNFIRFNERCFARLLGDMRSYNFVVVADEKEQPLHMKAIDFDQQCYEGRLNLYLPQFYKENYEYVQLVTNTLGHAEIEQIRLSEREQLAILAEQHRHRLDDLLQVMERGEISENYKVLSLRKELNDYFGTHHFSHCKTMGSIVKQQLRQLLRPFIKEVQPLTQ